jgi:polyhydroxyalkanoate synthase
MPPAPEDGDALARFVERLMGAASLIQRAVDVEEGVTPRDRIADLGGRSALYRYRSARRTPRRPPLLVVYAMVNRPEVLDLQPECSLIGSLLERGVDVYLIDWGDPDAADRDLPLAEFALHRIDRAVEAISRALQRNAIDMLGVCQGGTFALCYAALRPRKVRRLITTVTPVDFQTEADDLSRLVRHVDVGRVVDVLGNVPGALLNAVFVALRPFRLGMRKYLDFVEHFDSAAGGADFVRMERWILDSPAQPGLAFRTFVQECYQRNALVRGTLRLDGRIVELRAIKAPVLNIYARNDHLVPPPASQALTRVLGADRVETLEIPGGHIGIYVGAAARRLLPEAIAGWLARPARAKKYPSGSSGRRVAEGQGEDD